MQSWGGWCWAGDCLAVASLHQTSFGLNKIVSTRSPSTMQWAWIRGPRFAGPCIITTLHSHTQLSLRSCLYDLPSTKRSAIFRGFYLSNQLNWKDKGHKLFLTNLSSFLWHLFVKIYWFKMDLLVPHNMIKTMILLRYKYLDRSISWHFSTPLHL